MTLFEQVVAYENLLRAFEKVEENNGCAGFDGQSIEDFALNLEANLLAIRSRVLANQFRPAPLLRVYHPKEDGGKRPLSIPTVGDRVLHTAIAIVITPILDPDFADFSYAYREGRSVDQAVRRILALRDAGYVWVVDADIHRYFDEIPHRKLLAALEERIPDRRLLGLIRRCLKVDVFYAGSFFALKKGVAQGSPMSPVLANLYLDRLDETFERGEAKLVRFADDFVILCKSRPHAEAALELSEKALSDLRLRFNEAETRITHFKEGFRFLGVHFLRSLAFRPVYPEEVTESSEAEREAEPDPFAEPDSRAQPAATTMEAAFREVLPAGKLKAIRAAARKAPKSAETSEAGPPSADAMVEAPAGPDQEDDAGPKPTFGGDPILRTLYLVTQGSELGREDERFVIRKDGRQLSEVPALKVDQIMVLGNVGITTPAMQFCLRQDIPVFLLSLRGRYYGAICLACWGRKRYGSPPGPSKPPSTARCPTPTRRAERIIGGPSYCRWKGWSKRSGPTVRSTRPF